MTETAIMRDILIAVSRLPGTLAWRNQTGALRDQNGQLVRFGVPGSPDILACRAGRFIGIEVKTHTGRQSIQQQRFQAALERAGGLYIVARSVDDALQALA